jgi:hypothetical protein
VLVGGLVSGFGLGLGGGGQGAELGQDLGVAEQFQQNGLHRLPDRVLDGGLDGVGDCLI